MYNALANASDQQNRDPSQAHPLPPVNGPDLTIQEQGNASSIGIGYSNNSQSHPASLMYSPSFAEATLPVSPPLHPINPSHSPVNGTSEMDAALARDFFDNWNFNYPSVLVSVLSALMCSLLNAGL